MKKWILLLAICLTAALLLPAYAAQGTLILPKELKTIGPEAFAGVRDVNQIVLPDGLTEIGERAFADSGLGLIVMTDSVEKIASSALDGSPNACFAAMNAHQAEVCEKAGVRYMRYISDAEGAQVAETCEKAGVPYVQYKDEEGSVTVTKMNGKQTEVVIPSEILGKPVKKIEENCFKENENLTSVVISEGITTIGNSAFSGCKNLKSVTMADGVKEIGNSAFQGCENLTEVAFPSQLETVGAYAFNGCGSAVGEEITFVLPDHLTDVVTASWNEGSFRNCNAVLECRPDTDTAYLLSDMGYEITFAGEHDFRYQYKKENGERVQHLTAYKGEGGTVDIPEGIQTIDAGVFRDNGTVTAVVIPEGVTSVENSAFQGCENLKRVDMADTVAVIGNSAFRDCAALTDVTFSAGLTEIKGDAFSGACRGQEETVFYELPDSLTALGGNVFYNNDAVLCVARGSDAENAVRGTQYVYTHPGETVFRYRYDGDKKAERLVGYTGSAAEVTVPSGVWLIEDEIFKDHTELKKVVLSEGVTKLGNRVFQGCANLTDITLPGSLQNIENYAFSGCGSASGAAFRLELPEKITFAAANGVFENSPMILVCDMDSETAKTISGRGYSFARDDRPEEIDFRYRWDYFDHVYAVGLCDYAGTDTAVRLPDDCLNVNGEKFRDRSDLTLICAQLSDTAGALSRAELNFTFPGHENVRYRVIENVLYIMGYAGSGEEIIIPTADAYIKAGVDEQIRAKAFKDKQNVTKAVLPEGLTRINSDAFANCYKLTDITFPSTLKSLDQNVFLWCGRDAEEIFYFILPDNLEEMVWRDGGSTTFLDCNAVLVCGKTSKTAELLTYSRYVYTCPGEYDFRYRYEEYTEGDLTGRRLWLAGYEGTDPEVTIPEGIYGIERYNSNMTANYWRTFKADGFFGNTTVTKVVIPEGTVVIEDSAFKGCVNLTDITFPNSLKVLKNHAFEECGKAAEQRHYYVLPDEMEEISTNTAAGWGAFTDIGEGRLVCAAGSETARLVSEVYSNYYNGYYEFALKGHQEDGLIYRYAQRTNSAGSIEYKLILRRYEGNANEVLIPANCGVYGIEANVFKEMRDLKQVYIPEGVVEIGSDTFNGCTLLHESAEENVDGQTVPVLRLPSTLRTIAGGQTFKDVGAGFTAERFYLVLPSSLKEFDVGIFTDCNAVFVAPEGSTAAGKLYNGWYRYYNTLEDAVAQKDLQYKMDTDANGNPVLHEVYYGKP